ncbi:DNA (cytosine-5-)-methyltransferase [Streptococcus uberis]|uniref:DNA (cytosine-5-)-methyltransferase n=2 Tax=Streptococcus uberis TaxID=1349 RepID=UPI0012B5ABE8|nr:DNA (cytosine-5-)-methyltransferase [Streptococcus uberis]MTB42830.1 DNA (cytosine-5-)-methyltransferase [Streptococcus uberis]MTB62727.1 DNA (cytosine-5-)-methyltransferase [Streptococcus uberis]MTB92021.1 DNA (cytosine-5-)-methyltransferase [Streptococcus uberis]MWV51929.1 DNA (cytosine-5-)-methyltransferase [Streptococcus uberis]
MIETFSGIGSQTQALKNIGVDHEVVAIAEWDVNAMFAYDIMHNGVQDYSILRHHNKESLISELLQYNLSGDGKKPLTERAIRSLSMQQLKSIYISINRTNNLVDITQIHSQNLPNADILTYSFPCQDLSVSGHWHNNTGGIDRNAKNRSTLLWQIERILKEYNASEKELPSFLLMENVSNILSARHIDNFNEWSSFLKNLGYVNQIYTLDARNFGIPQSRKRTFMLSVLANNKEKENLILNYFSENNLEKYQKVSIKPIENFLKLDYSIEKYKIEALESTPVLTESRKKIFEENPILAIGKKSVKNMVAKTITTKQDRHPNSGVVAYDSRTILTSSNILYRNLTPRECFLLMGFDEDQFDRLVESNFETKKGYRFLSTSKLLKMAGNSIVVPVLEEIFKQVIEIENLLKN